MNHAHYFDLFNNKKSGLIGRIFLFYVFYYLIGQTPPSHSNPCNTSPAVT